VYFGSADFGSAPCPCGHSTTRRPRAGCTMRIGELRRTTQHQSEWLLKQQQNEN